MPSILKNTLLTLSLGIVYAFLFYNAELGINLFIFDALLIGVVLWTRPELAKHQGFIWTVGGLLFSAGCVAIVHTGISITAHHLTFILVVGFAQARELRFLLFAFLLGLLGIAAAPWRWLSRIRKGAQTQVQGRFREAWRWARLTVIPAMVVVPFLILYASGNAQFAGLLDNLGWLIGDFTVSGQMWYSFFITLFGSLLVMGLFFPAIGVSVLTKWQNGFSDYLSRKRDAPDAYHPFAFQESLHRRPRQQKSLGLKTEYRQAVLTFGLLNLMLAVVNATDLRYVWLDTGDLDAATLSQYVHAGTWNLVLSIALAMAVVTWYFRGNLNFLQTNVHLRPLAKLWLVQNAVLCFSVGIRNYHYINAYGLAYGRIYVVFILLLILFGLFTLWRKVDQRLSLSYLLQTNGMALWLGLLLLAAVNWDCVITRYNLTAQTTEAIDWNYLTSYDLHSNDFLLPDSQKPKSTPLYYTDWRSWNFAQWRNR